MKCGVKSCLMSALIMLLILGTYRIVLHQDEDESVPTMSRPGEGSDEVAEIQQALCDKGYPVTVSGIYDEETVEAITKFQRELGLVVSGNANAETLYRLGITVELNSLRRYETQRFLASTLDAVCRGASYLTKVVLGGMLLHRTEANGFPSNLSNVVFGDPVLREACRHDYSIEPGAESWQAAGDAIEGMSPCPEVLYFYRKDEGDAFLRSLPIVFQNGNYIFAAPPAE